MVSTYLKTGGYVSEALKYIYLKVYIDFLRKALIINDFKIESKVRNIQKFQKYMKLVTKARCRKIYINIHIHFQIMKRYMKNEQESH